MWIGRLSEWDELGELKWLIVEIGHFLRWAKVLTVSLKLHIFSSSDIVMDLLKRIAYFHLWGCCQWRHHRRQVCPGLQAPNTDPTIECECWRNITDEDSPAQSQVPCIWCHGSSVCRRAPIRWEHTQSYKESLLIYSSPGGPTSAVFLLSFSPQFFQFPSIFSSQGQSQPPEVLDVRLSLNVRFPLNARW